MEGHSFIYDFQKKKALADERSEVFNGVYTKRTDVLRFLSVSHSSEFAHEAFSKQKRSTVEK